MNARYLAVVAGSRAVARARGSPQASPWGRHHSQVKIQTPL